MVGALPGGEAALAGLEKIEGQIPEIAEKKLSAKLRDDEDILSQIEQNIADLDATVREVNLTQIIYQTQLEKSLVTKPT